MFTDYMQAEEFFVDRARVGIKPGLERVLFLLNKLDNPQLSIKAIHIAGTNGKGSTLNYLRNALTENGYKVGVFTSPSYEGLRGHIYTGNEKISKEEFLYLLNKMYPFIVELDKMDNHPTDFEIITVLSFLFFKSNVDLALIETGMGGREDTTNCIQPILSIITNVDYDHTAFLGHSLPEIASHKAGIIKENIPVIVGETKKEALIPIEQEASLKAAPIYLIDKDFSVTHVNHDELLQHFRWNFCSYEINVVIQMMGEHQQRNASLAIMALEIINNKGVAIQWDKSLAGLRQTTVPGRFEKLKEHPTIILDGAHNTASVEMFIKTVLTHYKGAKRHLIFAAFKDKDIKPMLEALLPFFETITLTTFESKRAARAEELASLVKSNKIHVENNWQELITTISHKTEEKHTQYFITGSLHFITLVRHYLVG